MRKGWIALALVATVLAGWGGYVVFVEESLEDRLRAEGYELAFEHEGERVWLLESQDWEDGGGGTMLTARVLGTTDGCYSGVPLTDPAVAGRKDYTYVCDGGSADAEAAFFLLLVPRDAVAAEYAYPEEAGRQAGADEIPLTVYDPRPGWPVKLAAAVVPAATGTSGTDGLALGTVRVDRSG